ncbi:MAG: peptide ligase PGM1-related protein [Beijerinckiaceae bacterium]
MNEPSSRSFQRLQPVLQRMYADIFPDKNAPRTIVVLPSLSLDREVLEKISGVHHYEERMLCLLLLLRMPRTRIIYLSSTPISAAVIDYYLHLLPGVPSQHARQRLFALSCDDSSTVALAQKLLDRPRLMQRIRDLIPDPASTHVACFNVSELEAEFASRIGAPIFGCDPALAHWGSKSGSRMIFREADVPMPDGAENLPDIAAAAKALAALKTQNGVLRKAVVKLNEGFSGEGNAVFDFAGAPQGQRQGQALEDWVRSRLPAMRFEAGGMTLEAFGEKFRAMGGIVEAFIEGDEKRSPSAQFRIDPLGVVETVSTHDQVLGGNSGQKFLGCRFPADEAYRISIQDMGRKVAEALARKGVRGRLGVDFISVRDGSGWKHFAIEANIRKGGTTHPYLMLEYLTDGRYDDATGQFFTPGGRPCFYFATDNLESERYRGLTAHDLIDIAAENDLHFHAARQEGVVFHLIGALSEFGKLGVLCIGATQERADALYERTVAVLDREAGR